MNIPDLLPNTGLGWLLVHWDRVRERPVLDGDRLPRLIEAHDAALALYGRNAVYRAIVATAKLKRRSCNHLHTALFILPA